MNREKKGKDGKLFSFSAQEFLQPAGIHNDPAGLRSSVADTLLPQISEPRVVMRGELRIMNIDYRPARLVRTPKRWYFQFYQTDPSTGVMDRHRLSFDIGHYPAEYREAKAREILDELNSKLPYGYPYDPVQVAAAKPMQIREALDLALKYCADLRPATLTSYRSWCRKFIRFLESVGLADQPVTIVNKRLALAFSDHLTRSDITARSHNNDINGISTIWGILVKRELVDRNPFSTVPRRKKKPSSRRPVPGHDIPVILQYLEENDISVYVSCLLLFYTLIRPNEQRQLQRYHFQLDRSLINIPGHISKNNQDNTITIPDELLQLLLKAGIQNLRPTDYVIGGRIQLGGRSPIGKSSASNRYREAIQLLHEQKAILNITGNTIYSWKNTGMDALANSRTPARNYQNQARHHSLEESERYMSKQITADPFIKENHSLRNVPGVQLDKYTSRPYVDRSDLGM